MQYYVGTFVITTMHMLLKGFNITVTFYACFLIHLMNNDVHYIIGPFIIVLLSHNLFCCNLLWFILYSAYLFICLMQSDYRKRNSYATGYGLNHHKVSKRHVLPHVAYILGLPYGFCYDHLGLYSLDIFILR
ncbi:hypothetical protein ACJX0J_040253, partial [Zea mays]